MSPDKSASYLHAFFMPAEQPVIDDCSAGRGGRDVHEHCWDQPNPRLPQIGDVAAGWYQGWYLELRLEEEAFRAERHGLPLTVAVVRLGPGWNPDDEECVAALELCARRLRRSDLPAITGLNELAICFTHTTSAQAEIVLGRISQVLQQWGPLYGVTSLEAKFTVNCLVENARRALDALHAG
jgi:hypothetical protein